MKIVPISQESDYREALKIVAAWFDNEPLEGSAEAQRFDTLVGQIEAYEAQHFPIDPN